MFSLSDCLGRDVVDANGRRLGRLADLGAALAGSHPRVVSVHVRVGRSNVRTAPWSAVVEFEPTATQLALDAGGLEGSSAAGEELRLARDVLDAQVVDLSGRHVVRVGDVRLRRAGLDLEVLGVDVGWASLLRRLGARGLARRAPEAALDWEDLHLVSSRGHVLQLRAGAAGLHRLGRTELAHLVSELPAQRAAEVLGAVGSGRAAGALAAAAPPFSGGLLEVLGPEHSAPIIAAMPADDAAAILRHVRRDRAEAALAGLPSARAAELRRLLAHPADTAGGLMSTDVLTAPVGEPAGSVRARVAERRPRLEGLATVFLLDEEGRPSGALAPSALLADEPEPAPESAVRVDTPAQDVIDLFALADVLAVPVVDVDGRLVGAVAIDDVLEELLAERLPGRRRLRLPSVGRHGAA